MLNYISKLSPKTKKVVLAVMASLAGFGSDLSAQLMSGTLNLTRAVVIGIAVGAFVRVVGAILSAEVSEPDAPPSE